MEDSTSSRLRNRSSSSDAGGGSSSFWKQRAVMSAVSRHPDTPAAYQKVRHLSGDLLHGVDLASRAFIDETLREGRLHTPPPPEGSFGGVESSHDCDRRLDQGRRVAFTVASLGIDERPMVVSSERSKTFVGTEGELAYDRHEEMRRENAFRSPAAEQCLRLEGRIAAIAESHLPVQEKADRLLECAHDAIAQGLPLRRRSYQDMFGAWLATMQPLVGLSKSIASREMLHDPRHRRRLRTLGADDLNHIDELAGDPDVSAYLSRRGAYLRRRSSLLNPQHRTGGTAVSPSAEEDGGNENASRDDRSERGGEEARPSDNGEEGLPRLWTRMPPHARTHSADLLAAVATDTIEEQSVFPYIDIMIALYEHSGKTFNAPSAAMMEGVMLAIRYTAGNRRHPRYFSIATRLFLQSDQWFLLPSRATYASYFDLCAVHGEMGMALRRLVDAKEKLFVAPSAAMCRAIIEGLITNAMVPEATAFASRISEVPLDIFLLDAILEAVVLSEDPMAAFSIYDSACGSGVIPSTDTFALLLAACERSSQWEFGARKVLHEMQRLKVRGDPFTLNLLLKGLLLAGLTQYAKQLYLAMCTKGVNVWPQLVDDVAVGGGALAMRRRGEKLQLAAARQRRDFLTGSLADAADAAVMNSASSRTEGGTTSPILPNDGSHRSPMVVSERELADDGVGGGDAEAGLDSKSAGDGDEAQRTVDRKAYRMKVVAAILKKEAMNNRLPRVPLAVLGRFLAHVRGEDDQIRAIAAERHDSRMATTKAVTTTATKTPLDKEVRSLGKDDVLQGVEASSLSRPPEWHSAFAGPTTRDYVQFYGGRSRLWKAVHKHFYGVRPAPLRGVFGSRRPQGL